MGVKVELGLPQEEVLPEPSVFSAASPVLGSVEVAEPVLPVTSSVSGLAPMFLVNPGKNCLTAKNTPATIAIVSSNRENVVSLAMCYVLIVLIGK